MASLVHHVDQLPSQPGRVLGGDRLVAVPASHLEQEESVSHGRSPLAAGNAHLAGAITEPARRPSRVAPATCLFLQQGAVHICEGEALPADAQRGRGDFEATVASLADHIGADPGKTQHRTGDHCPQRVARPSEHGRDQGEQRCGCDGSMPWGKSAAGLMRTVRGPGYLWKYVEAARAGTALPPAPTTANGGLLQFIAGRMGPRALALLNSDFVAGLPSARNASLLARGQGGGLRTLAPRAGLARGLGIAGGVVSTGAGLANLIDQGNPVEAFKARGTEYAADVASTAFSASSTAFFVAPTPVTAGATIVTGVAWLGLEAWNHREEIAEVWNDATDAVGDFAEGAADVAEDVGGFLNPFD